MQQELLLAREVLELAALLSVKMKDIPAFERHISQLKTYYYDFASVLPGSEREAPLLGLNLLRLLSQNRIAEFHTELELIPPEVASSVYVRHPVMLEQYLMEGSYNKVLAARNHVPHDSYPYFIDILLNTVRDEIADCSERAYDALPLSHAKAILMFDTDAALVEYANAHNWTIEGAHIRFAKEKETTQVPSMKLVTQTLAYAKELERIV